MKRLVLNDLSQRSSTTTCRTVQFNTSHPVLLHQEVKLVSSGSPVSPVHWWLVSIKMVLDEGAAEAWERCRTFPLCFSFFCTSSAGRST